MTRIFVALFLIALSAGAGAADNGKPPNIVLIIADYMGYHDTEPYGAEDIRTPSLSRIAAAGITMQNFYAEMCFGLALHFNSIPIGGVEKDHWFFKAKRFYTMISDADPENFVRRMS